MITFATFGEAAYAAGAAFSTFGVNRNVTGDATRIVALTCSIAGRDHVLVTLSD